MPIAPGLVTFSTDRVLVPGMVVARLRRGTHQVVAHDTHAFIEFDSLDLDLLGGWDQDLPARYRPTVPGWYRCIGRGVFGVNSTSRRGAWIALNGSTSGVTTLGGESLQAAGAGTTQVGGVGSAAMDGATDYLGLRVLQNSGGDLNLQAETTDGGSTLDVYYVGPLS